jgi:multiple sugar transport system ATP-binding protein
LARIDVVNVCKTLTDLTGGGLPFVKAPAPRASFSLRDVNLSVPDGRTLVVLGPSGCGKTTLLKVIAGLMRPDSGQVRYDGVDVKDARPGDRRIGMIFQNYALYPHFTAKQNILSYFFFRRKTPEMDALARAKYQRTSELMGVELAYLLDRKPTTLSGGERQRVAMGRCITRDAALFLVDEPFSNLDQALREKYRANLKVLLRQFEITTVYVTHDHNEALILADLLAIMDRGGIEQIGTCQEIYDEPRNVFVAGFLNVHVGTPPISLIDGACLPDGHRLGHARVGVRPEDVDVTSDERPGYLRGTVAAASSLPLNTGSTATIRIAGHEVYARTAGADRASDPPRSGAALRPGDQVWVGFRKYHLFDKTSGARLRSHPPVA